MCEISLLCTSINKTAIIFSISETFPQTLLVKKGINVNVRIMFLTSTVGGGLKIRNAWKNRFSNFHTIDVRYTGRNRYMRQAIG